MFNLFLHKLKWQVLLLLTLPTFFLLHLWIKCGFSDDSFLLLTNFHAWQNKTFSLLAYYLLPYFLYLYHLISVTFFEANYFDLVIIRLRSKCSYFYYWSIFVLIFTSLFWGVYLISFGLWDFFQELSLELFFSTWWRRMAHSTFLVLFYRLIGGLFNQYQVAFFLSLLMATILAFLPSF